MSAKQIRSPGEVGMFSQEDGGPLPPDLAARLTARLGPSWVVRGEGGYMYVLSVKREGEDGSEHVVSLRQLVDDEDIVGPLVSRRRETISEEQRKDRLLPFMYEVTAAVGVERDGPTVVAMAAGRASRDRTVAQVLDDVWRDDDWEPTVDEVVAAARAGGDDVSDEGVKKALQRGPFEQARPPAGRTPATWRRERP